jgi:hypothetical protein
MKYFAAWANRVRHSPSQTGVNALMPTRSDVQRAILPTLLAAA